MMGALSGVTGRRQAVCSSTMALGDGGEDALGALHDALGGGCGRLPVETHLFLSGAGPQQTAGLSNQVAVLPADVRLRGHRVRPDAQDLALQGSHGDGDAQPLVQEGRPGAHRQHDVVARDGSPSASSHAGDAVAVPLQTSNVADPQLGTPVLRGEH